MPEFAYRDDVGDWDYLTVTRIKSDVILLRRDVDLLKNDTAELKRDVRTLRDDVAELKGSVATLSSDLLALKGEVRENKAELKGEIKSLGVRMDGMDQRINDLHQSQTKWFMLLGILVAVVPIAVALVQSFIGK